jgi:hypothetical protein
MTAASSPADGGRGEKAYFDDSSLFPRGGYVIKIPYGDLGPALLKAGVIDLEKFSKVYEFSGKPLTEDQLKILTEGSNEEIVINQRNAYFLLNFFWALGLANKNPILEVGPMKDPRYGGAHRFASTGGWTLGKSGPMNYYNRHELITLSKEEQALVERVSKNIYRPCCGNSTYFPDCNHGMAMLGLLQLLASNGADKEEIYETALRVNSYWFPNKYLTIARYFQKIRLEVGPKGVLSSFYSSAAGYRRILSKVKPVGSGGTSCGV